MLTTYDVISMGQRVGTPYLTEGVSWLLIVYYDLGPTNILLLSTDFPVEGASHYRAISINGHIPLKYAHISAAAWPTLGNWFCGCRTQSPMDVVLQWRSHIGVMN